MRRVMIIATIIDSSAIQKQNSDSYIQLYMGNKYNLKFAAQYIILNQVWSWRKPSSWNCNQARRWCYIRSRPRVRNIRGNKKTNYTSAIFCFDSIINESRSRSTLDALHDRRHIIDLKSLRIVDQWPVCNAFLRSIVVTQMSTAISFKSVTFHSFPEPGLPDSRIRNWNRAAFCSVRNFGDNWSRDLPF